MIVHSVNFHYWHQLWLYFMSMRTAMWAQCIKRSQFSWSLNWIFMYAELFASIHSLFWVCFPSQWLFQIQYTPAFPINTLFSTLALYLSRTKVGIFLWISIKCLRRYSLISAGSSSFFAFYRSRGSCVNMYHSPDAYISTIFLVFEIIFPVHETRWNIVRSLKLAPMKYEFFFPQRPHKLISAMNKLIALYFRVMDLLPTVLQKPSETKVCLPFINNCVQWLYTWKTRNANEKSDRTCFFKQKRWAGPFPERHQIPVCYICGPRHTYDCIVFACVWECGGKGRSDGKILCSNRMREYSCLGMYHPTLSHPPI